MGVKTHSHSLRFSLYARKIIRVINHQFHAILEASSRKRLCLWSSLTHTRSVDAANEFISIRINRYFLREILKNIQIYINIHIHTYIERY